MKKLTIVIPIYNAQKNIRKCLDSILPQLTDEFELLLINDGSKDETIGVLREYEQKMPLIIRVIDKKNEGVAKTRNKGIEEARGEYICFIDNDDFIEPDYLQKYIDAIEENQSDVVIGGYRRVSNTEVKFVVKPVESEWYKFTVTAPWAKIYRKAFLLENGIQFLDYKLGEDIYFSLALYAKQPRISTVNYIGYNWYYNEESVSNTVQRGFNPDINIIELTEKLYCVGRKNDKLFDFFYVRYLIWYLLFSGRQASKGEFLREYHCAVEWLIKKRIAIKFPLFSSCICGERITSRLIVNVFISLHKLHLIRLFAHLYCKG